MLEKNHLLQDFAEEVMLWDDNNAMRKKIFGKAYFIQKIQKNSFSKA
jgi:hypothetical protein